jgi:rhamnose transport system ATP-binding protein
MDLEDTGPNPAAAIDARGLTKSFGGISALSGVDFTVRPGTVHALVGENGAGKSTALGAIAGRLAVDSGSVTIHGVDGTNASPRATRALGIAAIYQELTIIPSLTAMANVFLGQAVSHAGVLANRRMRERYAAACTRIGVSIPATARAGDLSVADQQMLEIMRALESGARVVLLDEPTASLVQSERDVLLGLMRELRAQGVSMVLVSHNLDEVLGISDDVTVFRNGRVVASRPTGQWDKPALVAAMLGQDGLDLLADHRAPVPVTGPPLLEVRELDVPGTLESVSFSVRAGEVLGVAGLMGSGRTTIMRALAGLEPTASGRLHVDGEPRSWPRSVRSALGLGIALVPEDRKGQGLLLNMSSLENVGISNLGRFTRGGVVRKGLMRKDVAAVASTFAVDTARLDQPVGTLSGGNQQKVLLTRWRMRRPRVFLADEPTRGIDVGAKASILSSLRRFASEGAAVVVVSSELEELTAVADRVVVVSQGRLVQELTAGSTGIPVADMLSAAFSS